MTDMAQFEKDLVQCRGIASSVKSAYDKQASKQLMVGVAVGAITGAVIGSAVGSDTAYQGELTQYGAATGAAAGVGSSAGYASLARFGPNRIVDRCMANRDYQLLNDFGAGVNN